MLAQAATVVMLVGPGVKERGAQEAVVRLAEAIGYAVAVTPEGKVRTPTCSTYSCSVGGAFPPEYFTLRLPVL